MGVEQLLESPGHHHESVPGRLDTGAFPPI